MNTLRFWRNRVRSRLWQLFDFLLAVDERCERCHRAVIVDGEEQVRYRVDGDGCYLCEPCVVEMDW